MDPGLSRPCARSSSGSTRKASSTAGDYIVNWCPRCRRRCPTSRSSTRSARPSSTTSSTGPLSLATVRPETMLGDTAVAVHPEGPALRELRRAGARDPVGRGDDPDQVVADAAVDPKFGTGAVKVTPAHDPNDFEIGRRHGLEVRQVIGFDGTMNERAGKYAGLDRFEARERIVEDMTALGLIEKIEPYQHRVGACYRCKTVVEPLVSKQWFVRMKPLADPALEAVRDGRTRITPRSWTKTYFAWIDEHPRLVHLAPALVGAPHPGLVLRRGGHAARVARGPHRVPGVPRAAPPGRGRPRHLVLVGAVAVLDARLAAGRRRTSRRSTRRPCLVTGYDIIFFWVARMMMLGLHFMGEVPFRDVYIHALVRDMEGQKMSKSKGNVVDPLDVMEQFGTDALRFTLTALAAQGREIRLSNDRIEGYRNFANKLWNAARFVLSNLDGYRPALARKAPPTLADRWIMSRLHRTILDTRQALAKYRFNDAASAVYQFLWHDYCDWYLEWSKLTLYRGEDPAARARTQATLLEVLETTLRLLHPFMPFITEEIWQRLPKGRTAPASIMIARYPRIAEAAPGRRGRGRHRARHGRRLGDPKHPQRVPDPAVPDAVRRS